MKKCLKCKLEKGDDSFNKNQHYCRICQHSYDEVYRIKKAELKKEWRVRNKDKKREMDQKYRENGKKDIEYIKRYILTRTKFNAKKRGLEFELTKEDIDIPKFCPVLGLELKVGER